MRRRKWRRLVNRYGLNSAFQSTKVKLDYREPALGGDRGDSLEDKMILLIIGVVAVFFVLFYFFGLK